MHPKKKLKPYQPSDVPVVSCEDVIAGQVQPLVTKVKLRLSATIDPSQSTALKVQSLQSTPDETQSLQDTDPLQITITQALLPVTTTLKPVTPKARNPPLKTKGKQRRRKDNDDDDDGYSTTRAPRRSVVLTTDIDTAIAPKFKDRSFIPPKFQNSSFDSPSFQETSNNSFPQRRNIPVNAIKQQTLNQEIISAHETIDGLKLIISDPSTTHEVRISSTELIPILMDSINVNEKKLTRLQENAERTRKCNLKKNRSLRDDNAVMNPSKGRPSYLSSHPTLMEDIDVIVGMNSFSDDGGPNLTQLRSSLGEMGHDIKRTTLRNYIYGQNTTADYYGHVVFRTNEGWRQRADEVRRGRWVLLSCAPGSVKFRNGVGRGAGDGVGIGVWGIL